MTETSYRTYVIVNPQSSGGSTAKRWRRIEPALRAQVPEITVGETERQGHASELCRQALRDGYEMVVAVGGDGTIHEVVNGFFDEDGPVVERPILGLVPGGTGGDFRKTYGWNKDPEEAARRLVGREVETADAGRITWTDPDGTERTRYFANIASVGLAGYVSRQANEQTKLFGGRVSFFVASFRALMRYRNHRLAVSLDGGEPTEADVTVGTFCLGRYFGGGMMIAPQADPSDGKLDVVFMNGFTRWQMMRMTSVYKGKHLDDPRVSFSHARVAHVEAVGGEGGPIEADGEVFGQLPARFEVLPGAYAVKV